MFTQLSLRPTGTRAEWPGLLRQRLAEARRHGDAEQARRVCQLLDNDFVSRAYHRADDPEIRRLRRQVRAAA